MSKKIINERCPLQEECERKCSFMGSELDCDYYEANAREDLVIEDQETRRREIWQKREEAAFEAEVAQETEEGGAAIREIVYIPVKKIFPHPDNPRKDLGDLSELADSIKANGIFQNLTVVPAMSVRPGAGYCPTCTLYLPSSPQLCRDGHADRPPCKHWQDAGLYTVVIGHRRLAAAKLAGLAEVPCIISDMDEIEQVRTMMVENMQRSDLSVYEQARGFQMMLDLGDTVETISEKTGFSTTTVRRRVKMMELDQNTLKEVSARQPSLSDFDQLAQIQNIEARNKCLEKIGTSDFSQSVATQLRLQAIKDKLPAVRKALKAAKAKAIKENETWGSKYDGIGPYIQISDWDESAPLVPGEAPGKLFYNLDEKYGRLRFYEEHKRAAPVKKSAEELERQKKLAEAWARVDELRAVTYQMRSDFVKGLSLNSKNGTVMLKGAIRSIVFRCIDYVSANRELLVSTLGIDDGGYSPKRAEEAAAALAKASAKAYPALIYANFGDGKELSHVGGYKGEWPKYERDARLSELYAWLCSLGYEMSNEEKELQEGTHELFSSSIAEREGGDE